MNKQEFKVGDRVRSLFFGWGTVKKVETRVARKYPVEVDFDSGIKNLILTKHGFLHESHENPAIFLANQGVIEFDTDEPIELEDGHPIWVLSDKWIPMHYARRAQTGGVYCYQSGKSKHSSGSEGNVTYWSQFRTTDPALDGSGQQSQKPIKEVN